MANSTEKTAVFLFVLICVSLFIIESNNKIEELSSTSEEEISEIENVRLTENQPMVNEDPIVIASDAPVVPEEIFDLPPSQYKEPVIGERWPSISSSDKNTDFFSMVTPHFKLHSYNRELLNFLAARIDCYYENIFQDIGFYEAGVLSEVINIFIYCNKDEYVRSTKRPDWSAGFASVKDMAVFTYEHDNLPLVIPHELTHLMFGIFLNDREIGKEIGWVHEGLAVYEEMRVNERYSKDLLKTVAVGYSENTNLSFSDMAGMIPGKDQKEENARLWYAQAGALVKFLISERTNNRFYNFCGALRNSMSVNEALSYAYAGEFKSVEDIEPAFRMYIKEFSK